MKPPQETAAMWRRKRPHPASDGREASSRLPLLGAVLALSFLAVFWDEISSPLLYDSLHRDGERVAHRVLEAASSKPGADGGVEHKLYVPPSLDAEGQRRLLDGSGGLPDPDSSSEKHDGEAQRLRSAAIDPTADPEGGSSSNQERRLSLNLGGGNCKWQPPTYAVPEEIDFQKTLIAGFPSGDKRMVFLQMEALSGWPCKDEWDFAYGGYSNHPFIKTNYPHHEGIWGWGDAADQVVLVVPNVRKALVEYHDIRADVGFGTTWEHNSQMSGNLYNQQPTQEEYLDWRDSHVMDEILWYGWFTDYWMEGGLCRDVFTHQLTTRDHFVDLVSKPFFTREQLAYENYVANGTTVDPTYDPHCDAGGDVSGGCHPVAVVSVDNLKKPGATGRDETNAIASALTNDVKTGQYVIAAEAWACIWRELIQDRKGPRVMDDRPGFANKKDQFNFSEEMLQEMINELDRLIDKYGGTEWSGDAQAARLVAILTEHRAEIQAELDEVLSGARMLGEHDFLGPKERARQRALKKGQQKKAAEKEVADGDAPEGKPHLEYFAKLEQKRFENKRRDIEFVGPSNSRRLSRGREEQRKLYSTEESMSDEEFVAVLVQAQERIRGMRDEGKIDDDVARELRERVQKVAREARVLLPEDDNARKEK